MPSNAIGTSALRATVVVIPRDSLSLTADTVQRALDVTQPIFKLMVFEGGAAEPVRKRLRRIAAANPGRVEVVASGSWIDPRAAVNDAIHRVSTEYVVFLENDVEVAPGWLEALIACADKEQAGCVHPVYVQGSVDAADLRLHTAGGRLLREIVPGGGRYRLRFEDTFANLPLSRLPRTAPRVSDFFEWACVLFRARSLERIHPLQSFTVCGHLDDAHRWGARGERILCEPRAVVARDEDRHRRLSGDDLAYHNWRWDPARARESLERFAAKWAIEDEFVAERLVWTQDRLAEAGTARVVARPPRKLRKAAAA